MARFDERFLSELKERLRPSEVIGKRVKLRRQGREWVGLSPFSQEKSPSFYVNDQKGFYHDFSSGKHGDIINFLQETERLSFHEAVEILAREAGLALPVDPSPTSHPDHAHAKDHQALLFSLMSEAQDFFTKRLFDTTPDAKAAYDYLLSRGLSRDEMVRFGLGYAPRNKTALLDYFLQKGAKPTDLMDCGLILKPENASALMDRYRDRIIFPITNIGGKIVSFGGRALSKEERAKYLNGPESPLFHKGRTLYGLYEALKLLGASTPSQKAPLVVVEGYMDVLACHRAGIAAVAPLGTALTEEQIALLWRRHREPTLCFDGDGAGLRAAHRALDRALPHLKPGQTFRVCFLPEGKDPDDVLRTQGADQLIGLLSQTKSFNDALFEREVALEPLLTPEAKAGLRKRLRHLAQTIEDKDLSQAYVQDFSDRCDLYLNGLRPEKPAYAIRKPPYQTGQNSANSAPFATSLPYQKGGWRQKIPIEIAPTSHLTPEGKAAALSLKSELDPIFSAVLVFIFEHPETLRSHSSLIYSLGNVFKDQDLPDALVSCLLDYGFSTEELDKASLSRHLHKIGQAMTQSALLRAAIRAKAPFLKESTPYDKACALWQKTLFALVQMTDLNRQLSSQGLASLTPEALQLKGKRDVLKRLIKTGEVWLEQE